MSSLSPSHSFSLPSLLLSLSFLIAKDAAGRPVGFVNFRFDLDESIEVVYWYVNLLDIYTRVLLFFVRLPKCVGEGRKNDPKHIQI